MTTCASSFVDVGAVQPAAHRPATYFAPAGRAAADLFCYQRSLVAQQPLLCEALDAMPNMVMILNSSRQIVAANSRMLALLNATSASIAGRRPGEAVGCVRVKDGPDGCGTSPHCAVCGAVGAILGSQREGQKVVRECRILVGASVGTAAIDLRATASPLCLGDQQFTMFVVEDISKEKQLAVLQRTFFHDLLNTAGCVQGYAQFLAGSTTADNELCSQLVTVADRLIEEILSHRDLMYAESGELATRPMPVDVVEVLQSLRLEYSRHPVGVARVIRLEVSGGKMVVVDRHLLMRVLGNMLKNALEATPAGGVVTVHCVEDGGNVMFAVHNAQVMPEDVQLQLFQRSFSTKQEPGHGIGTYSMKLLGERYLSGRVDFTSRLPEGTTFMLTIPKIAPTAKAS